MLLAVHYRVMEHLGSLESTQEARVALGYASGNSYASFVLSKLPACSITRWCTLKHEPIVNLPRPKFASFDHSVTSVCHELSSDSKIFITYLVYIWCRSCDSEKNVFCLCCLADAAVLKYVVAK